MCRSTGGLLKGADKMARPMGERCSGHEQKALLEASRGLLAVDRKVIHSPVDFAGSPARLHNAWRAVARQVMDLEAALGIQ